MLAGLGLKLLGIIILIAIMTSGYFYIQKLRADVNLLELNEQVLKDVVSSKETMIKAIKDNLEQQTKALDSLNIEFAKTQERNNTLLRVLGQGRIGRIAAKKPLIIEKKINSANKKWLKEMRNLME